MEDLEPVVLDLNENPFIAYANEQSPGVWGFQFAWRGDIQASPMRRVNNANALKACCITLAARHQPGALKVPPIM